MLMWNGPVLRRRRFTGQPKLQRRDQDIQLDNGPDLKEKILVRCCCCCCCCSTTETMFETCEWIIAWNWHAAKTRFIPFTRNANSTYFTYKLNCIHIAHPHFVKDFGVLLDTKLHFQNHVDHLVAQALEKLGLIRYNTSWFPTTDSRFCIVPLYGLNLNSPV